jgi:hypothetical protein
MTKTLIATAALSAVLVSTAQAQLAFPDQLTRAKLVGTPLEQAKLAYESALRTYNGSTVRTKEHRNYVVGLRARYAAEYRRDKTPSAKYDHPYTGELTIERIDSAEAFGTPERCRTVEPLRLGCAMTAGDLSRCRVYIASDSHLKTLYPSAEVRKLFGINYETVLRHELAHCNGWPSDHPQE